MRWLAAAIGAGLSAATGLAHAAPIKAALCSEGPAASSFGLAKAIGSPKVFLKTCPPGAAGCTEPPHMPYVIAGDEVVVGARSGDAVCVAKPNRLGDTAGWVTEYQIEPLSTPPAPLSRWIGHWTRPGGDSIDLTLKGGALTVSGAACSPACNISGKGPVPNVGDLDDKGAPQNGRLRIGRDDDCAAEMWLVGPYLVVFDNLGCGGMNVSFTGIYRRARRR